MTDFECHPFAALSEEVNRTDCGVLIEKPGRGGQLRFAASTQWLSNRQAQFAEGERRQAAS